MTISKQEFDVLQTLESAKENMSAQAVSNLTGISFDKVNKLISDLKAGGLISGFTVTENGLAVLEPYRVRKAVFMAAGFGSRMVPVTLERPKPLVRVNGVRIIDTIIDACLAAGIDEIYVVRGYLAEQFDELLEKYPMIKFVENPLYSEANNISSVYLAGDLLKNSYLFEADIFVYNPDIVKKYQYVSNILGIYKKKTEDWCVCVDENMRIYKESIGGENCYQMVGITYINAEDGEKLKKNISETFNMPDGKERYWSTVPLISYNSNYNIYIRPGAEEDVIEIDTFDELKSIDKSYETFSK